MIEILNEEDSERVKLGVQLALSTGKSWEAEDAHYPAGALIREIEFMGLNKDNSLDKELSIRDGFQTNGWDYDWWQYFVDKDGRKWVVHGSGYYGGIEFAPHQE